MTARANRIRPRRDKRETERTKTARANRSRPRRAKTDGKKEIKQKLEQDYLSNGLPLQLYNHYEKLSQLTCLL